MVLSRWPDVPEKYCRQLAWWLKAYQWFNRKHPKHAARLRTYVRPGRRSGFTWGASARGGYGGLDVHYTHGLSRYGVMMVGGLYTQHYIDYYLLKNAPVKNPPMVRPRKPAGYDAWLIRFLSTP